MKRVSRVKLYSSGFSVSPLTILHFMLCRREISLFFHNNQTISHHSSLHSPHVKNEVLNAFTVHVDGRKEHALYHSTNSVIQFQSQNHLFVLSSSPDSEANTPSSSFFFNPHLHNSIHSYAIPTRQKQHQKTNATPTVPFPFRYYHSQSITFILTLKYHTTHFLVTHSLFSIPLHWHPSIHSNQIHYSIPPSSSTSINPSLPALHT